MGIKVGVSRLRIFCRVKNFVKKEKLEIKSWFGLNKWYITLKSKHKIDLHIHIYFLLVSLMMKNEPQIYISSNNINTIEEHSTCTMYKHHSRLLIKKSFRIFLHVSSLWNWLVKQSTPKKKEKNNMLNMEGKGKNPKKKLLINLDFFNLFWWCWKIIGLFWRTCIAVIVLCHGTFKAYWFL